MEELQARVVIVHFFKRSIHQTSPHTQRNYLASSPPKALFLFGSSPAKLHLQGPCCDANTFNGMAGTRLRMWTLKPTVDGWVVEGYRQPDDDYWHSSTIKTRVSARAVETRSGNRYILEGEVDHGRMEFYGFPPAVVEAFRNGFPEDWVQCLKTAASEAKAEQPATPPAAEDAEGTAQKAAGKAKGTYGKAAGHIQTPQPAKKAPKTPTPAKQQTAGSQDKATKEKKEAAAQAQEGDAEGEEEEEDEEEEEGGTVRRSKRKHQPTRPHWIVPAEAATDKRLLIDYTGSGSFQSELKVLREETKRPATDSTERPSKRQKKTPQPSPKPKKRAAESEPEAKPPAKKSGGKVKEEDTGQLRKRGRPPGKAADKRAAKEEPGIQENGTGKGKEKGTGKGQEKTTGVKQKKGTVKNEGNGTGKVAKKGTSKTQQKGGNVEKETDTKTQEVKDKDKEKATGKNPRKDTKAKKEKETTQAKQAVEKQEKQTGKSQEKAAGKQSVKGAGGGKVRAETQSDPGSAQSDGSDWGQDEVARLHQARSVVPMTSRNYWAEIAAVVATRQPLECYDKIHNTPSNERPRKAVLKKEPAAKVQQSREDQKEQLLAELASKPIGAGQRSKLVRKLVELEAGQGGDDDLLASTPYRDVGPRANPLATLPVHTLPLTASSHSSIPQSSSPGTDSPASPTRTDRLITPFGKAGDREGYKASRLGNRKWPLVGPKTRGQATDGAGGAATTKSSRGLTQALSTRGGHMFAQWTEEDERDSGQDDEEEEEDY